MYDVVAIGELLIDFTPSGITEHYCWREHGRAYLYLLNYNSFLNVFLPNKQ